MEKLMLFVAMVLLFTACSKKPQKDYPIKPVPFTDVQVTDQFWQPRMETNRTVTIPYDFKKCEETGRIDNFAKAGGLMEGEFVGIRYNDSDVYKVIEGAAYSLRLYPDPQLEQYLDDLIAKIAAAQEDDGYLYTARTINPAKPPKNAGPERWSYLIHSHELYNVGHMYEAAVAYYQATGKRSLLDVAIKNANLIDSVFGPGKKHDPPGHQEIEIGLTKLYRVTGDERYLKLAKFFLDQRGRYIGRKPYDEYISAEYTQDHKPVIEQDEAVGHAVRAGYMYSGMADVAALTGDQDYIKAIDRIWENVVSKKLYITGGIGARSEGEAFGDNYELPNLEAYNETCAAIANMFWNHRLFLLHGDAKYIDVLERTLYNGFLSGVGLDGNEFFYPNPLESDGRHKRSPWFDCACCPVNVVRFLPSLPGYVYAQQDDDIFVNLFMSNTATIKMKDNSVKVTQATDYPWDGKITITVSPEQEDDFTIHVRIPGWALGSPVPSDLYRYLNPTDEKITLLINGQPTDFQLNKGFALLKRRWKNGDTIELHLPMTIHKVVAHDSVKSDVGKLSLERGPIVYCAEWVDNGGHVLNLMLPKDAELQAEHRADLFNGVTVLKGQAVALFSDPQGIQQRTQEFVAIPYYAWAHRGPGEMAVWLPYEQSAARAISFSQIQ
ncbi:MAG: glycoside hydrolase family 127 protein [candidate division KSB1 bacterium]|nr:glycoside hydrolase family 127 protein [candidate division KSB1 bacterium]MDZ7357593.1 glycoside hydrolase family 127 protein [candidate division KSB1 bacterium]MDZ7400807.1 glycoside hydrolase family 127 protein [candidate division KSB1 bacterium]